MQLPWSHCSVGEPFFLFTTLPGPAAWRASSGLSSTEPRFAAFCCSYNLKISSSSVSIKLRFPVGKFWLVSDQCAYNYFVNFKFEFWNFKLKSEIFEFDFKSLCELMMYVWECFDCIRALHGFDSLSVLVLAVWNLLEICLQRVLQA